MAFISIFSLLRFVIEFLLAGALRSLHTPLCSYLVHEVFHVSVEVVGVLISRSHHQHRPALLIETARVHLGRGVLLSDQVHLLRQNLSGATQQHPQVCTTRETSVIKSRPHMQRFQDRATKSGRR